MVNNLSSKKSAQQYIKEFFSRFDFNSEEMKKVKRLAMKYRISLKENKKLFCKSCLSKLKGKIRISKTHKTIICEKCNYKNKFKIK